ncbi:C-type lectin domain family 2 member D3-like isoform X1 [Eublepharis macularius]|uniref:C-type lectin domain family 2 member D3-like isoform X1 n=1 Tax=Eublepharis macularius TaxID=481883 RepID=A0AA97KXF8_EUBMA|nr:C-type lectin domain family 2 member D3-like isoform X1 [Eublepharis macularius]
MVASMDSVGNQPEVSMLLSPGIAENESRNQTLEQKRPPFSEHSGRSEQNGRMEESRVQMPLLVGDSQNENEQDTRVRDGMEEGGAGEGGAPNANLHRPTCSISLSKATSSGARNIPHTKAVRCRLKCCKKDTAIIVITIILFLSLLISGPYNVAQHAQIKELQAEINKLQATSTSTPLLKTSCPQGWIGDAEGYCYFFSVTESPWNSSRDHCALSGGSLVTMATDLEKAFINNNKGSVEYWLGLRRRKIGQPWKQPDGSDFDNSLFGIKGNGLCATLNDGVQSSTDCDNRRNWICRKPLHGV